MKIEEVTQLFSLAQIKIIGIKKIENRYWPNHENYAKVKEEFPWWEVTVDFGKIVIGWRKRVINIDWQETNRRGLVTRDDVTKSSTHVHAYSIGDALKYLSEVPRLPTPAYPLLGRLVFSANTKEEILSRIKYLVDSNALDIPNVEGLLGYIGSFTQEQEMALTLTSGDSDTRKYSGSLRVGKLQLKFH